MEVSFDLQDDLLSWRTLRLLGGALYKLEQASSIHYKEVEQVSVMEYHYHNYFVREIFYHHLFLREIKLIVYL